MTMQRQEILLCMKRIEIKGYKNEENNKGNGKKLVQ